MGGEKCIVKSGFFISFSKEGMLFGLCIAIFFGLIFGSFWSVILSRWGDATTYQQASSILWWRSECPHCKHRLQAWDLVPLFSFLFQGRKCRYCHKKISRLYPILELGSAIIFGLCYWYLQKTGTWEMLFWIANGWILWLLLVYDVLWYEVHIPLVIFGGVLIAVALGFWIFDWSILVDGIWFFVFFFGMYWIAKVLVYIKYRVNEEGIWFWDVIVAPYLWILLRTGALEYTLEIDKLILFIAFLVFSAIIGVLRYEVQNKHYDKKATFLTNKMAEQSLPLLPAMILGLVVVLITHKWVITIFFQIPDFCMIWWSIVLITFLLFRYWKRD